MSSLQEFCHLVVRRNKANLKRKRLLYALNRAEKNTCIPRYCYHIKADYCKYERSAYRDHANAMKQIAKDVYSPMKRELKVLCSYDANNKCIGITHDGVRYSLDKVTSLANAYLFETVVLSDDGVINEVYEILIN